MAIEPHTQNWDEIMATLVADKVLAKIGDQFKMPPDMAALCKALHTGADWSYVTPIGFGPCPPTLYITGKVDSLRFTFHDCNNMRLMEFTLHA